MSETSATKLSRGVWSDDEHERFLDGMRLFPNGPWKAIAERVGTRSVRQVQTHALVYQERAARRLRDLHQEQQRMQQSTNKIEQEIKAICETLRQYRVPVSPRSTAPQGGSIDQLTAATLSYLDKPSQCAGADGNSETNGMPTFDECIDFLIDALASSSVDYSIE